MKKLDVFGQFFWSKERFPTCLDGFPVCPPNNWAALVLIQFVSASRVVESPFQRRLWKNYAKMWIQSFGIVEAAPRPAIVQLAVTSVSCWGASVLPSPRRCNSLCCICLWRKRVKSTIYLAPDRFIWRRYFQQNRHQEFLNCCFKLIVCLHSPEPK